MKVKELIEKLSAFDGDMEVTISDGYECVFYKANADYDFVVVESAVDPNCVDIGIGGCIESEDD